MRAIRVFVLICVVTAVCSPADAEVTHVPAASPHATPACLTVATPHSFAQPTFIDSSNGPNGRAAVVDIETARVLQVLAPACPHGSRLGRAVKRTPHGHLLVGWLTTPAYRTFWKDPATGVTYEGQSAAVSPDGRRVATLMVSNASETQVIRVYAAATGQILNKITVVPPRTSTRALTGAGVTGFDWTPNGTSLVIALSAGRQSSPGLYVVSRSAHRVQRPPTIPNPDSGNAYWGPAVLSNWHVVTIETMTPIQRTSFGAVVDIDLRTHSAQSVLGTASYTGSGPSCTTKIPRGMAAPAPLVACSLSSPGFVDGQRNRALVTDGYGDVWVYGGKTVRNVVDDAASGFW